MCGIYGFVGEPDLNSLRAGLRAIQHRGPDAEDCLLLDFKVHLGHRRLSILDLSESGAQPMKSHHGDQYLIYNGEVYNYRELRKNLIRSWRGHSDTEVILEAFSEWGFESTLRKLKGMFGLAFYDANKKKLFLARDRFGEKPLYYGYSGGNFFFGSELKSFREHPEFIKNIDRKALNSFFKYNYVPAPLTIYEGISKLEPGCFVELDLESNSLTKTRYWDFSKIPEGTCPLSFADSSLELERLLKETIRGQMLSDVPLGAFLSGGVDSSLIVALMQSISSSPVKTFTIGFHEKSFNEAVYAKKVAEHLATDHHELYISPQDALDVVPKLSHIYDEPFSDSSQIPTFLVSEMTKKKVTVALSGDAGDEIFGGYNRYFMGKKISKSFFWLPHAMRQAGSKAITSIRPGVWDKISPVSGDKIHKLASVIGSRTENDLYDKLLSHWDGQSSPVLTTEKAIQYSYKGNSFEEKMMLCDALTYLPDDILVKVDRASMAVSLETRVPFLDHEVAEFGRRLPLDFKINNGKGKVILREILYRYVPKQLIERPKMGFGVPIEHWLRSDLKDWAAALLDEKKISEQGLLDYSKIKEKWEEHLSGKRNWQYLLWDVLMFQDWYENSFIR